MNNREKISTEPSQESQEINAEEILRDARRELILNSLASREGIEGLEAWRNVDREGKSAGRTRKFFDTLTAYDVAARKSSLCMGSNTTPTTSSPATSRLIDTANTGISWA